MLGKTCTKVSFAERFSMSDLLATILIEEIDFDTMCNRRSYVDRILIRFHNMDATTSANGVVEVRAKGERAKRVPEQRRGAQVAESMFETNFSRARADIKAIQH